MNTIFTIIIFLTISLSANAQDEVCGTKKERKRVVKELFGGKTPLIILNEDTILTIKQYYNYKAPLASSGLLTPQSAIEVYGEKGRDGIIFLRSKAYDDKIRQILNKKHVTEEEIHHTIFSDELKQFVPNDTNGEN